MDSRVQPNPEVPLNKTAKAPAVIARGLIKRLGRTAALRGVDLDVVEGEVHALAGHNGAGKTTLFRLILGLLRRDGGDLKVLGVDPQDPTWPSVLRYIGYVPEDAQPYERLTGYEYLRFFAKVYTSDPEEADKMMSWAVQIAGLSDADLRRKAGEYSNGMKKRLMIARALMHRPRLVLLDEPTNGLDVFAAHEVRELIKGLSRIGTTFLIATHNMAEAQYLADRVTFLAYGKVIATGTVKELLEVYGASDLEEAFVRAVRSSGGQP
ncbi:MAG: ABC-type multidrug transport system, ATPase component [uncultured Acidilobus sp. CIS]|nr:MAG: ABC-type multidrug transport system, ATPase component [uncultured Acidilobus sp. CIS]